MMIRYTEDAAEPLLAYYGRLGMTPIPGAGIRRASALQ
jgi:hypothetical protein